VVEGIVEDVLDRGRVLLLRFDQLRPEAPAEDVVAPSVALVEGACVAAVEVAHTVREVGLRRFNDQVVVVAHQAADMDPPLVALHDAVEDVEEDDAVEVVQHDRRVVVAARADVVEGAGGEVTARARHSPTLPLGRRVSGALHTLGAGPQRPRHVPGTRLGPVGYGRGGRVEAGRVGLG
jgi:hypothetical protein